MKHINFLILGLFIYPITVSGQIIDFKNDKYWIDAGGGGYLSTDRTNGTSLNFSVNLISDGRLYKIRFLNHQEFQLFGPEPLEGFYSVGMMIGKGPSYKYIQIQFSGGLGITGGVKRGKLLYTEPSQVWFDISDPRHYDRDYFITPSIPWEIDLIIKPIKYLGAGFAYWGDLNYKRPMFGLIMKFGIGKLR